MLLSSANVFAKAETGDACEARLDPEIAAFDASLCQAPREFRARGGIAENLNALAPYLTERVPSRPHRQWSGTCYLYNKTAMLESALTQRGLLKPDDYVDGFMMAMKVAFERMRKIHLDVFTLTDLLDAGSNEVLFLAGGTPLDYLDGESLAKVGGPDGLARIERGILRKLNTDLRRLVRGEPKDAKRIARRWLRKMVSDPLETRGGEFTSLIRGDMPTFLKSMRKLLESKLSAAAGEEIRLRSRRVRKLIFDQAFAHDYIEEHISHRFTYNYGAWQPAISSTYGDFTFESKVLRAINADLARGRGVAVVVRFLFNRFGRSGSHVILLTGMVVRDGKLLGYKYLNTWSQRFGVDGYGYIDRHTLEHGWRQTARIDEIELE